MLITEKGFIINISVSVLSLLLSERLTKPTPREKRPPAVLVCP